MQSLIVKNMHANFLQGLELYKIIFRALHSKEHSGEVMYIGKTKIELDHAHSLAHSLYAPTNQALIRLHTHDFFSWDGLLIGWVSFSK